MCECLNVWPCSGQQENSASEHFLRPKPMAKPVYTGFRVEQTEEQERRAVVAAEGRMEQMDQDVAELRRRRILEFRPRCSLRATQ